MKLRKGALPLSYTFLNGWTTGIMIRDNLFLVRRIMELDIYSDIRKAERGAWISIAAYIGLSVFKLVCGFLLASSVLVADGYNNLTDIVASVAVLIGLRISQKPPDSDHTYGHLRAETIAALIASLIMTVVGIQVIFTAVSSLISGKTSSPELGAAWVAMLCAIVMGGVYLYNRKLAKQINSGALMAAAKDNLSDAFVSVGATVGIIGSQFGLPWLDTVAALGVGIIICRTAWSIFRDSTHNLSDGYDEKELVSFRSAIHRIDGVEGIKELKARVHGNKVLVDVVIEVDPGMTVQQSHEISDRVEAQMHKEKKNVLGVHVHVEPKEDMNHPPI